MPQPLVALGIAAALIALTVLLFWPESGLVHRWTRTRRLNERVLREDALKHLHKCEMGGRRPALDSLAGVLQISRDSTAGLVARMEASGLLLIRAGDLRLTPRGREAALHIIRAHRLWERYLADETGFDEALFHEQAERFEHTMDPVDADALSARLGNPTHDPHGDPIPDSSGQFVAHGGQPLLGLEIDQAGRIVHVEDEPETVYAQLLAEGLYPGMSVRLIEATPTRVRFWANGDEHVLAPIVAANIAVIPMQAVTEAESEVSQRGMSLGDLELGEQARVISISPRVRGPERRRLMDLGLLPGTAVTAELVSPGGDPTAYRIREALIALREEQARQIAVEPLGRSAD